MQKKNRFFENPGLAKVSLNGSLREEPTKPWFSLYKGSEYTVGFKQILIKSQSTVKILIGGGSGYYLESKFTIKKKILRVFFFFCIFTDNF